MLENIHSPADIKNLTPAEIAALCEEIRGDILTAVSKNGGHLASNLGIVETTVALHRVFDAPRDAIVFDVGHQCYAHKILTGRREGLAHLRKYGGLSGFPRREESEYDPLSAGHSGPALSSAIGMAEANRRSGKEDWVIAVIGDASFGCGMVYEALQNCAKPGLKLLIVLNDNEMSISKNVGALSDYFTKIRLSRGYFAFKHTVHKICARIPVLGRGVIRCAIGVKEFIKRILNKKNIFENLGLEYLGPVDGSREDTLEYVFREAIRCDRPCIVHVITQKGRGYAPAEEHPDRYHAVSPFDPETGIPDASAKMTFSRAFGESMCRLAKEDDRLCAITAAMRDGTGLTGFAEAFPDRFYDVGIAEEHAVSFAAGLARGGLRPVTALYSTFAQRTFDQVLHDCALQKLPVVLALDRAGIVPGDGSTHQGLFDVGLFTPIPGVEVYAPESYRELDAVLETAVQSDNISVIRYPRGSETEYDRSVWQEISTGITAADFPGNTAGKPLVILTYGRIAYEALRAAAEIFLTRPVRVIRLKKIFPLDKDAVLAAIGGAENCLIVEEGMRRGGIGEMIAAILAEMESPVRVKILAASEFVPHGDTAALTAALSLDAAGIIREAEF